MIKRSGSKSGVIHYAINPDVQVPVRALAESRYVTSDVSLIELARDESLRGTHVKTLESWCKEHDWVNKRRSFREAWLQKVNEQLGDEIAQSRVTQLRRLEGVLAKGFATLESDVVEPRSYEGLLCAMLRLLDAIDERREQILAALPARASTASQPQLQSKFTEEETIAVAKLVIGMRREALRKTTNKIEPAAP